MRDRVRENKNKKYRVRERENKGDRIRKSCVSVCFLKRTDKCVSHPIKHKDFNGV